MGTTRLDILVNNFATRSFRDIADRDYVSARLAFQAGLIPQFQWSALHCLEKYVKAILLYNRISSKGQKHEVSEGLHRIQRAGKFEVEVSDTTAKFVQRLEAGAHFRYFEVSYSSDRNDLFNLDKSVSEVRRYCQVLDYVLQQGDTNVEMLNPMLAMIRQAREHDVMETCINGGWLEGAIRKKDHPARSGLIWNNLYFSSRRRQSVEYRTYRESGNSPLYLHPEIVDEIQKYVFLPKEVANAWREEARRRATQKKG